MIRGAGHHVYADRADAFNDSVNRICQLVDAGLDVTSPIGGHTRRRRQSSECTPRPHERNAIRQQMNENSHKAGSKKGKLKHCSSSPDFSSMKYTLPNLDGQVPEIVPEESSS